MEAMIVDVGRYVGLFAFGVVLSSCQPRVPSDPAPIAQPPAETPQAPEVGEARAAVQDMTTDIGVVLPAAMVGNWQRTERTDDTGTTIFFAVWASSDPAELFPPHKTMLVASCVGGEQSLYLWRESKWSPSHPVKVRIGEGSQEEFRLDRTQSTAHRPGNDEPPDEGDYERHVMRFPDGVTWIERIAAEPGQLTVGYEALYSAKGMKDLVFETTGAREVKAALDDACPAKP